MANNIQTVFSKNLVKYRSLKGLSQEQAADLCDLSLRYYQSLEAQEKWARPVTIAKIAKGLRVKETDLFAPI